MLDELRNQYEYGLSLLNIDLNNIDNYEMYMNIIFGNVKYWQMFNPDQITFGLQICAEFVHKVITEWIEAHENMILTD